MKTNTARMNKTSITTYSGVEFDIINPTEDMISLQDICHALSNTCRFSGHVSKFYSVAAHSLIGSYYILPEYRLEFLLHDATEAYIGDVTTPLKSLISKYKRIESNIDAVIRRKYGLPIKHSLIIKDTDLRMLATEKRDLIPNNNSDWAILDGVKPYDRCDHFDGWLPELVASHMLSEINNELEKVKI